MLWSAKQLEVVNLGEVSGRFCLLSGSTRSGKTLPAHTGFTIWSGSNFRGHEFLVAAPTMGQVDGVQVPVMMDTARSANVWAKAERSNKRMLIGDNRYHLYEGSHADSASRIQGFTFAGAILDEAAVMDESFIAEVVSRCSIDGAKIVMTANPEGPSHWLKSKFIDRIGDLGGKHWRFEWADNPVLDAEWARTTALSLTGVFYRRRVLGEWAAATGQVYPDVEVDPPPSEPALSYEVAADHATSSVTHALLVGTWVGEHEGRWVVDEFRYDGRETGQISDVELAERMLAQFAGHSIRGFIVDPYALSFKAELRRRVAVPVVDAHNDVIEGVQTTQSWLAAKRMRVSPACPHLLRELGSLVWDEAAAEKGEDRPVKFDDHGTDALRYYCFTRARDRRRRIEVG